MNAKGDQKVAARFYVVILPVGETAQSPGSLQEAGAYAETYNDLMSGTGRQAVIAVASTSRSETFAPQLWGLSKFRRHRGNT